ncbi:hypothetical protein [Alkalihalobacillus deserti]|nr:hypothetical protein [Alkalihalobacillus deserti]
MIKDAVLKEMLENKNLMKRFEDPTKKSELILFMSFKKDSFSQEQILN